MINRLAVQRSAAAEATPICLLSIILTMNWHPFWRAPRNSSTNEFLSALSLLDRAPSCCASDATIPSRRQELPYRHRVSRCDLHQQQAIVCGLRLMSSAFFCLYILCCIQPLAEIVGAVPRVLATRNLSLTSRMDVNDLLKPFPIRAHQTRERSD
jgi:hypothetical protein